MHINCFECYKKRVFSNFKFLEEFYLSDDLLNIGYNIDLSYIDFNIYKKNNVFLNTSYDYDLYSDTHTQIWRLFDCEMNKSHVFTK